MTNQHDTEKKITVTLDLLSVKHALEIKRGRMIRLSELAQATGLSESWLYKASRGYFQGVRFDTLEALLAMAEREDLDLTLEDFFSIKQESAPPKTET